MIFEFCLIGEDPFVHPSRKAAPLSICGVSREWRYVALTTPSLWASLAVPRSWRKHKEQSALDAWLCRSKSQPLTLQLSLHKTDDPLSESIRKLGAHSNRWAHLRLNIADEVHLQQFFVRPLPFLHTLELRSQAAITDLYIRPSHVPRLQHVNFNSHCIDPSELSLPWNQISSLSTRYWTTADLHNAFLQRTPNLESARISVLHGYCSHDTPIGGVLCLPNLKKLEIVAMNGAAMSLMLAGLRLPALEDLVLTVPEESPEYEARSVISMVSITSMVERLGCRGVKFQVRRGSIDEIFLSRGE